MPPRRSNRLRSRTEKSNDEVITVESPAEVRSSKKNQKTCCTTAPTTSTRQKQKQSSLLSKQCNSSRAQPRPITISLDVTFSSTSESDSECDESDIEEIHPSPCNTPRISRQSSQNTQSLNNQSDTSMNTELQLSRTSIQNEYDTRIIDSDSDINDDTGTDAISFLQDYGNVSSDSNCDDLYEVNFQELRLKNFEAVEEELKSSKFEKVTDKAPTLPVAQATPVSFEDNDLSMIMTSSPQKKRPRKRKGRWINTGLSLSPDTKVAKSTPKVRTTKKVRDAITSLKAFSERLQHDYIPSCDNSLADVSDDVIMADDSKLTVRIHWGMEYIRYDLNQKAIFAAMYQEFAEKHKVSVSQVVLSFQDKIISPDKKPSDIGLTSWDIIEGGVINQNNNTSRSGERLLNEGKDSITLKIQTANRKVVHKLPINKYDKLSLLMSNYAKLRGLPLEKLRFKFDGDPLDPSETPADLDLEGGECIDAFET